MLLLKIGGQFRLGGESVGVEAGGGGVALLVR
jgi:hypothetical protein